MEIMKKERGKEKGGEGERNRETEIERERKLDARNQIYM